MEGHTIRPSTPTSALKQSHCNDLKSLHYVLMYFFCGAFLWQDLDTTTKKQNYDQTMEKIAVVASQMILVSQTALMPFVLTTSLISGSLFKRRNNS
jgi:hypothetical protein